MPTLQAMRRQILGLMTSAESLTEARAAELLELFEVATAEADPTTDDGDLYADDRD